MKWCCLCKLVKPLSEFNKHKNRKDGYCSACRECDNLKSKINHEKNKQRDREKNKRKRQENREFLRGLKDGPCVECEIKYPYYVMQFETM
jgi:hypothetical protein